MVNTLIGLDYTGTACIKMTKDGYEPDTTPDSTVGAFLYNSKWAADVKYSYFKSFPRPGSLTYYPSGSGPSNYEFVSSGGPTQVHVYRDVGNHPYNPYSLPLFEVKSTRTDNGQFVGESYIYLGIRGYQERGVRLGTSGGMEPGWLNGASSSNPTFGNPGSGVVTESTVNTSGFIGYSKRLSVWRLPGDEAPIQDGTPVAPVPGQDSIIISNTSLKVAKPGYNVNTATPTQLSIDTGNTPTKIIAADDISIPSGTTVYDCGFTLAANTVIDVHYYVGGTIYYPAGLSGTPYGAEYYISGSSIVFVNSGPACRARFMVLADDGLSQTSGTNDVLRKFNDGTQNVIQFLKPGSSSSPSLSDIALDSRWPCIQVLAEGVIGLGGGAQTYTIPFNGAGTFPMVKYCTIHGAGSYVNRYAGTTFNFSKRIRQPISAVTYIDKISTPYPVTATGDCTYCTLTSSSATFHSFVGNPTQVYFNNAQDFDNNTVRAEYDSNPPYAIRYYIFGITKP
jgi:hypothetical protein